MFQGSVAGFATGGTSPALPSSNRIERFPFAESSVSSTCVGSMTICRYAHAGTTSSTHGFNIAGGQNPGFVCSIESFPFSMGFSSSCLGVLGTTATEGYVGTSSPINGYLSGGGGPLSCISKFPFAGPLLVITAGGLTQARDSGSGASSYTHGYDAGGAPVGPANNIQKFSFQSDASATNIGTMSPVSRRSHAGISSCTNGYAVGGGYPVKTTVTRYPFSSDAGGTDISNLSTAIERLGGSSSITHGYFFGGNTSGTGAGPFSTGICRFPFASDTSNASVGNLTCCVQNPAGHQD